MIFSARNFAWFAAFATPLFYFLFYTPYGMDTTDFGYFYAYAWRILQGQIPYRDFFYIKPALPLYWHAFWLSLTPESWQILAGKAGFCASLLAAAWFCALYLRRVLNFEAMGISLPVMATVGFVFSVHSFPHMPWHTADGVLFCAASLYAAIAGLPVASGLLMGAAALCKESFILVPFLLFIQLWVSRPKSWALRFVMAFLIAVALWGIWLVSKGAWNDFRSMTTGQLDINEALEAGIYIYLRQNWLIPIVAVVPWLVLRFFKKTVPPYLTPAWCYLLCLTIWYIQQVYAQKTWIGFGASWPTLFLLLGGVATLLPAFFLRPLQQGEYSKSNFALAVAFACPLLVSWSAAISGGYKIPAMFACPLLFAFFLWHWRFFGSCAKLQWGALAAGLIMFFAGYQYPYVFPVRPLARAQITLDAGDIYPQAQGVKVDPDMYERLAELKELRQRYGANYKTLPGFSFAYYLNGDQPVIASDWLIDWEINGKIAELYQELLDKDVVVFMERDQLDTAQADGYSRAGYGVPQLVRKNWNIIEETPHFVVFKKPLSEQVPVEQTN